MVFGNCEKLETIYIPKNITSIGDYAFGSCTNLTDVWYTGSEGEFKNITIDTGNDCLLNATLHYNYSSIKYGFVTGGNEISAVDALAILQTSVNKITFTENQIKVADVNGDGQLTAIDSLLILHYSVGKITKFPVEM